MEAKVRNTPQQVLVLAHLALLKFDLDLLAGVLGSSKILMRFHVSVRFCNVSASAF